MVREGVITTPSGVDITIDRVFHSTLQDLYSSSNYLNFGVKNRAELQTYIATNLGYKNWAEFAKDSHNKGFMKKGDRKQFFNATVLRTTPSNPTKINKTEAPVTQTLEGLQEGYNQEQC